MTLYFGLETITVKKAYAFQLSKTYHGAIDIDVSFFISEYHVGRILGCNTIKDSRLAVEYCLRR
jgi:hypothetical protein